MTHIRYRADGRAHSLELCGHANYAAEGPDIVCAGLSAITYALMGFLMNLDSGAPAGQALAEPADQTHRPDRDEQVGATATGVPERTRRLSWR